MHVWGNGRASLLTTFCSPNIPRNEYVHTRAHEFSENFASLHYLFLSWTLSSLCLTLTVCLYENSIISIICWPSAQEKNSISFTLVSKNQFYVCQCFMHLHWENSLRRLLNISLSFTVTMLLNHKKSAMFLSCFYHVCIVILFFSLLLWCLKSFPVLFKSAWRM